jgi:hypothetical protein
MSYVHPWQYFGLDFLSGTIAANVDRHVRSLRDYVSDSQVYQAFLYQYSADGFRRKLFAPINGARSWMFKSFPERPVGGFGVIDAYDTPTMGYYAQKRTFAPVTLSYAIRYALESVPAGSPWKAPVWVSNATNNDISLTIDSALYNLKGERLLASLEHAMVPARQARNVFDHAWRLPEEPGIYLLRGRATQESAEIAGAAMYVKIVPRPARKILRVLVLGTPVWAQPVADYLSNLGASVTPVIYEPTVVRGPENPFPASADDLRRDYDVIWLTGFDNYWREAPEQIAQTIVEAVKSGVTFIHSGSWGSYHGGGNQAAALDLTPLAQVLPVEVRHENDVFPRTTYRTGAEVNAPPPSWPGPITASEAAPAWLRGVDFTGLTPLGQSKDDFASGPGYQLLPPRPGATVLLRLAGHPLLVSGHFGKGLSLAYLGFSPAGSGKIKDHQPVIVDRAIRSSVEGRLFTIVTATLLSLASGEDPSATPSDCAEARARPLFETLKNMSRPQWPEVTMSWTRLPDGYLGARIHIHNGPQYVRGLRLRFDGPDFRGGNALALWTDQFFDLLPSEQLDCTVQFVTSAGPLHSVTLEAEQLYSTDSRSYSVPPPPR